MVDGLLLLLKWSLRLFGVFWIIGGIYSFQVARQANFIDSAIEQLTQSRQDRRVTYLLLICAFLTLLSGIGLVVSTRWALLPLGLLLAVQGLYFAHQQHRFRQATSQDELDEAQINPATRNAFVTSIVVTVIAGISVGLGVLR